jgi:hypothetical protein
MGEPVPFGLRIFSTLNAAGPAADFFAIIILFALPHCRLRNLWSWPLMTLAGGALLITLVRASWIALIVGAVVYLLGSPRRFRTLPFLVAYVSLLVFLMGSLPALLGAGQDSDVITARIATLGDVSHDNSALARSMEISESIQQGLANPLGEGLGQIGASSALSSNPSTASGNVLDSGYLARFLELGWLGFAGYAFVVFGSFGVLVVRLLRGGAGRKLSGETLVIVSTAAAMCVALLWLDAAGDSHLGLDGLLFWIALGIGLRRPSGEGVETPSLRTTGSRGIAHSGPGAAR